MRATLPAFKTRATTSLLVICVITTLCLFTTPHAVFGTKTLPPGSVPVNMLVNYGNGTLTWFNATVVPSRWNFYNVTVSDERGNIASIFFASFGSHFVYQINGVGCPSSNPFCDNSWGLWTLQGSCWTLASSGIDQIPVSHEATIGWYLVPAETLGNTPPTGVNCLPVNIDVKPPNDPVHINSAANGNVPVLILSTPTFNATTQVNLSSLTFGETGTEHSLSFCSNYANGNVTGLLCLFSTQAAHFTTGDTTAILNGLSTDGSPIVGTDSIIAR